MLIKFLDDRKTETINTEIIMDIHGLLEFKWGL